MKDEKNAVVKQFAAMKDEASVSRAFILHPSAFIPQYAGPNAVVTTFDKCTHHD